MSHRLINQDSGKVEYYTPSNIIEAAREVLGAIDLDPFSSLAANATVKAYAYRTRISGERTFTDPWTVDGKRASVWMNHPFSRAMNARCIRKLIDEYEKHNVRAACCITFASTSEAWFRPLLDYPQCFLFPRTNYLDAQGNKVRGVTKGSVVTYLGPDTARFARVFSALGTVKVPYLKP